MSNCVFFSSRRRHTRCSRDWSSDVCSSDLSGIGLFALSYAYNAFTAFAAATVFAAGVCYFWPTMLGITSEQFPRSEEHTSELQSRLHLVCRLLLEKKKHPSAHTQLNVAVYP